VTAPGEPDAVACGSQHCITCGDDGVAMTVVAVDPERGLALCADDAGQRSSVEIGLVDPVAQGDRILVHAGVALVTLGDGAAAGMAVTG
jgi:hydrogenase maturation factor